MIAATLLRLCATGAAFTAGMHDYFTVTLMHCYACVLRMSGNVATARASGQ